MPAPLGAKLLVAPFKAVLHRRGRGVHQSEAPPPTT